MIRDCTRRAVREALASEGGPVHDAPRPAIEVRLKRGAPRAIRSPLWRPTGRNTIIIHASLLADPPAEIEDAFEYFLTTR